MSILGISDEYLEMLEDDIAEMITASEGVDKLRSLAAMLHQRQQITTPYYHDLRDTLDQLSGAVLKGKRRIAAQRNAKEMAR